MNVSVHIYSEPGRAGTAVCSVGSLVERRLRGSGYAALGRVRCEFERENGTLHLSGSVRSYYLKQIAQQLVLDIEGVRLVNNRITVERSTRLDTECLAKFAELEPGVCDEIRSSNLPTG